MTIKMNFNFILQKSGIILICNRSEIFSWINTAKLLSRHSGEIMEEKEALLSQDDQNGT